MRATIPDMDDAAVRLAAVRMLLQLISADDIAPPNLPPPKAATLCSMLSRNATPVAIMAELDLSGDALLAALWRIANAAPAQHAA